MNKKIPKVSVVIPTLNEEENISRVLKELPNVIDEIIVVDGYSADRTIEFAKKSGVKVLYDNRGKGSAIRKGLSAAKGDIIITMDADLSHRMSELNLLIEAVESGYDIAMGSRFICGGGTDDMPLMRKLGNQFFVSIVNLFWNTNYSDLCYGYRAFRKDCIRKLELKSNGFGIETEISIQAAKKGLKIIEIPSFEKLRDKGHGKLKSLRDGFVILRTIINQMSNKY